MTTNNEANQGNSTALTVRQERMLAVRDEMGPGGKPGAIVPRTFGEAEAMCRALAKSGIVPQAYRDSPENMIVTIMAGAEIGLPPMASLRLYHIMDNIPRLSSEGIRAVLLARPDVIEYFEPASGDEKHATWVGKRVGRPEKSATWTIERAKRAGLTERKNRDGSPGNWVKYPEDMLNARASMQLARMLAPDLVAGMVSREEAGDGDFIEATATETRSSGFQAPPQQAWTPATGPAVIIPVPASGPVVQAAPPFEAGVPTMKPWGSTPPSGPPPGVPQTDPPKRGPGRPPKDASARPTTPAAGNSKESSPPAIDAQQTASSNSSAPSPTNSPASSSAAPDKLTQAVQAVADKAASAAKYVDDSDPHAAMLEVIGATPSTASTDSDDSFGAEDPVDSQPADEVATKMSEFYAWVAGCKSQTELRAGLPSWQAWTRERSDKHNDLRFRKQGELTIAMQDAYSKRKGEVAP